MTYVIEGLPLDDFRPLFGQPDEELARRNVRRVVADSAPGYPCRVKLEDVPKGESLLLLNHEYQPARTPYQGRHAIFVSESATAPARYVHQVPAVLTVRKMISLRGFDPNGWMEDADVVPGAEVERLILKLFENPKIAYLHAHNAGRGCFAARIDRG
jgi:Protein of unknown function (DUF1203)